MFKLAEVYLITFYAKVFKLAIQNTIINSTFFIIYIIQIEKRCFSSYTLF